MAESKRPAPKKKRPKQDAERAAKRDAKARTDAADRAEKRAIIVAKLTEVPLYWMAAAAARVHPDTLAAWRRDDPEFDLDCREARAAAVHPWVLRLRDSDSSVSAAAARYLEKVAPGEFRRDDFVDDLVGQSSRPARVVVEIVPSPRVG